MRIKTTDNNPTRKHPEIINWFQIHFEPFHAFIQITPQDLPTKPTKKGRCVTISGHIHVFWNQVIIAVSDEGICGSRKCRHIAKCMLKFRKCFLFFVFYQSVIINRCLIGKLWDLQQNSARCWSCGPGTACVKQWALWPARLLWVLIVYLWWNCELIERPVIHAHNNLHIIMHFSEWGDSNWAGPR